MPLLSQQEIERRIAGSDWTREGDAIVREWTLGDFVGAIAFVNRVAELAEAANHHPDVLVHGWNHVRLTLSTHSPRRDHRGRLRARGRDRPSR